MDAVSKQRSSDASRLAVRPVDRLGRVVRDLRISVIDRCNMRCEYCMPKSVFGSGYAFFKRSELLTFDEIFRTVVALKPLGIKKVRLTGGEPLLRANLEALVEKLKSTAMEEIAMTTNGLLLTPEKARRLRSAGLTRVTISLDALDPQTFHQMTSLQKDPELILNAIQAANQQNFRPVKVNAVIQRGVNEEEILPLARYFRHSGNIVRFIEYMDVGNSNGWQSSQVFSAKEILDLIKSAWNFERLPPRYPGEVAQRYRYLDGAGEFGVIASVTKPFCSTCGRLRLTADGQLYTCLFSNVGHDIKSLLRSEPDDKIVGNTLAGLWSQRADHYSELRSKLLKSSSRHPREMWQIGG